MNELIQEISTYLIISGTAIYTLYKMVQFFTLSQNKGGCSGCMNGSCGVSNKHAQKKLLSTIKRAQL
jgi:hypothetical protein